MPRLRDPLVNGERVGEIRRTIVRLPQDKELPVVRKNAIWGCGCWGSRHPNLGCFADSMPDIGFRAETGGV